MHHHHMSWPLRRPEPARCIGEGGRAGWLATRKGPTPSHRSEARRISISELWINGLVFTGFLTGKPWEGPIFHGKIDGFRVRCSQENQSRWGNSGGNGTWWFLLEIAMEMGTAEVPRFPRFPRFPWRWTRYGCSVSTNWGGCIWPTLVAQING